MRERPYADAGCHAAPKSKESFCCEYSEGRSGRTGIDLSACAGSEVAFREQSTARQSSFSQLKLSENRRKHFISNDPACCMQRRRQRSQHYERLVSLATAKLERRRLILELAHPPLRGNVANSLEIHEVFLLKSSASRQEKPSACNRNCAPPDEHFCHDVALDRCTDMNTAWAKHLNSLLDDNGLTTDCESVTHKICDSAA